MFLCRQGMHTGFVHIAGGNQCVGDLAAVGPCVHHHRAAHRARDALGKGQAAKAPFGGLGRKSGHSIAGRHRDGAAVLMPTRYTFGRADHKSVIAVVGHQQIAALSYHGTRQVMSLYKGQQIDHLLHRFRLGKPAGGAADSEGGMITEGLVFPQGNTRALCEFQQGFKGHKQPPEGKFRYSISYHILAHFGTQNRKKVPSHFQDGTLVYFRIRF